MRTNRRGIALIQEFESCQTVAYPDPASELARACFRAKIGIYNGHYRALPGWELLDGSPWTCGFGSTGPEIGPDTTWTQEQADERFAHDLQRFEREVESMLTFEPTSNEFSALVSFAYNVGVNALAKSTLLRKFNAGDTAGAANEFLRWDKAGGNVLAGLARRRDAERDLFLSPDDNDG